MEYTNEMIEKAKKAGTPGELLEDELENVSGGGCGGRGGSKSLTAADMSIGTHVIPYGLSCCWDMAKGSGRVVEDGVPPTGCNARYFVVTNFDIATGAVTAACSGCGRKIRVAFSEMQKL